ncbi:MAG: nitroreductase family protein [Nanoarchaeota archaeon]
MDFQKVLKERHSVRKFKSTEPDWRDIIEAVDSARFSPMAGNIFTLKAIIVRDPEKIEIISRATQQNFVGQVKCIVVFCSKPERTKKTYKDGEKYVKQQTGAAMQNFWLSLTEKGLSTCWIGYFVESQIKRALKIPEDLEVEAIFPIGYEVKKPEKKEKILLDNILYFDVYGNKKMIKPEKLNA